MHSILNILSITFIGVLRDRVFHGIILSAVVFILIPSISSLSMRQVVELSITLSLSLISFILLLLSVFLGGTSIWKDLERRYSFSVMGLPITRTSYITGKFAGIAGFILLTTIILGVIACVVIWIVSSAYPPLRPVVWHNVVLALAFDSMKYILLVALAFLISTVSTSFFLPIFGSVAAFLAGSSSQQVYDFLHSSSGASFSPVIKKAATALYYVLPNFSAFDLKVNAIYGVGLSLSGLALTGVYFIIYTSIVLMLASMAFSRRELQ